MLDERAVSWKVLLPSPGKGSVLVVGLPLGEVASLSRSWPHIDWIPHKFSQDLLADLPLELAAKIKLVDVYQYSVNKYELIVLCNVGEQVLMYINCLKERGTLVLQGGAEGSQNFLLHNLAKKFSQIKNYGLLPVDRPRIIFSLKDKRLIGKALSFHTPGSRRSARILKIVKLLVKFGMARPFFKANIIIANRQPMTSETLLGWLQSRMQHEIDDFVVYCGSDAPNRKITLLAVGAKGQDDFVVKVADTRAGAAAIKQEVEALESLKTKSLPATIPRVLLTSYWNGYFIQVQNSMPKSIDQIAILTEAHLRLLASLLRLECNFIRLSDSKTWQRIVADLEKKNELWPLVMNKLAANVCSVNFAERKVLTAFTHGDFTPWNMSVNKKSLAVWDWEDSEKQGLAFFDICHFIVRQAVLVGPWPGGAVVLGMIKKACSRLMSLAQLTAGADYSSPLQIWLLREYTRNPSKYLVEIAACLDGE